MQALPIDLVVGKIVLAIQDHGNVVVLAPPGAGKTTRVPPAIVDADCVGGRRVVVLEPRRLAARTAARRIAAERNVPVGSEVGFAVRFERNFTPATRILIVTEGVLLRMLQDDPFLDGVGAVVFDEFHERSLDADLALALTRAVQRDARPDLKIVAMSATLDAAPVAAFLGDCPVVDSPGRQFPVEIEYAQADLGLNLRDLPAVVKSAVMTEVERSKGERSKGDILVFLPGVGEIRRCRGELQGWADAHQLALCELYGDLPAELQDAAIQPGPRRKAILSTNVAETSVTAEGVTAVVDTGLARVLRNDPRVGLDRLELCRISKASADQRAGRAGRTAPGRCIRLWTRPQHGRLAEREIPAVARVDLAGPVLQLAAWGERDPVAFGWFEIPNLASLANARQLLTRLGALDAAGGLTSLGKVMANLPAQPRLSRLLIEGHRLGNVHDAALLAALLGERDPFIDSRRPAQHVAQSDLLDRLETLDVFARTRRSSPSLNHQAASFILRSAEQLERAALAEMGRPPKSACTADEAVLRALLASFPDRLCRRREAGSRRSLMVGNRGVVLHESSAVADAELFLAIEADARGADDLVFLASAVDRKWLPPELLEIHEELHFDESAKRVWGRRQTRWFDLALDEVAVNPTDAVAVSVLLAEHAAERLPEALALDSERFTQLRARIQCLRAWMPELELPALDDDQWKSWLPEICAGHKSFAALRSVDLATWTLHRLSHRQRQAIDREAPERLPVPSGNKIALHYEFGRPPILAVRIQELFGLTDTPRIAGGRVGVLLHLLAPNHRPQQVTDDLRSFWTNTYPLVRKELRARYPKHAWPEDPWTATAERRPRRRPAS